MHTPQYYRWSLWLRNQITYLITPISRREDDARQEYVLNVLLIFASVLSTIFLVSVASLAYVLGTSRNGISIVSAGLMMIAFTTLLVLSKIGYRKFASWIFLALLIGPTMYSIYRWGTLLPIPLLALSLIIIMTSILIGARAAILMAIGLGSYLGIIMYADQTGLIQVDHRWMGNALYSNYAIELSAMLLIIGGVTWLAYREIETSLRRARRSEAQAQRERTIMEERIQDRTKHMNRVHLEHVGTMVRLAEIGKLSAGFFHDLVNPLTAVKLYVSDLQKIGPEINTTVQQRIRQAVSATDRLVDFTNKMKRELGAGAGRSVVHIKQEIEQALDAVKFQAHQNNVELIFNEHTEVCQSCNPLKLHRALVNIILNAIEACSDNPNQKPRTVTLRLRQEKDRAKLSITDTGAGIDSENIPLLFEPFFTTKPGTGLGLGLSITKDIMTQELNAVIAVTSQIHEGTHLVVHWTPSTD